MPSPFTDRATLFSLSVLFATLLCGCDGQHRAAPVRAGTVNLPAAREISGIAASRRADNLYWIHNDSGQPLLYAIDGQGRPRGSVRLNNTKAIDWEDIASFELDGQSWLLIADTGDNLGNRKNCALRVIAEPDPADLSPEKELTAPVAWITPVAYPDGSHDCEAVAVDARDRIVFLLTKRTAPPALYSLPLRPPATGPTPNATLVSHLTSLPQPSSTQKLLPTPTGRYRGQPTAMDIAADRGAVAVLTYGDVLLFSRYPGETWIEAFARTPELLPPHGLPQAEALCFSRDSRNLYVMGEQKNPPLLRYDLGRTKGQ